jgi:hypothetical protein
MAQHPVPKVDSVRLVLEVTLKDGTVLRGACSPHDRTLYNEEDAYVFTCLDGAIDKPAPLNYQQVLASTMTNELRHRRTRRWSHLDNTESDVDVIEECLRSMIYRLPSEPVV